MTNCYLFSINFVNLLMSMCFENKYLRKVFKSILVLDFDLIISESVLEVLLGVFFNEDMETLKVTDSDSNTRFYILAYEREISNCKNVTEKI